MFSEMAEEWMRKNMPMPKTQQTVTEATDDMNSDAPGAWKEDFTRWVSERCINREDRDDWGGIGSLWVDFCEWVVGRDSVPCIRWTFERLLDNAGFLCSDGMVSGLILRRDFEAADLIGVRDSILRHAGHRTGWIQSCR
jgi:hypothetical protein